MTKSIRQRLILLTVSVLILSLLGSFFIALRAFNSTLRETTYAQLSETSDYLNSMLEREVMSSQNTEYRDFATNFTMPQNMIEQFNLYSSNSHQRITIIDLKGIVLYDSDYNELELDNHLWREEVQQALKSGIGMSERKSDTQGLPVLYLARRIAGPSEISILRVSTTLNQLQGYQESYLQLFYGGLLLLMLIVGTVTATSIAMITRPLKRINEIANQYALGNLDAKIKIENPKELAELAATMQNMASQLKQTLARMHEGLTRLETILENMNEGIILVDSRMVIQVTNQGAKLLLGPSMRISEKQTATQLHHTIRSTEVVEACAQTLVDGKNRVITTPQFEHLFGETALLTGRSQTKILKFSAIPVYDESQITGAVITINDMTEITKLEQVRKDFVANVSHELKTPITAISGFSQLLQEQVHDNPEELAHFAAIITRQAENMQRIVEDLLLLSSLEQQNAKPTCTWTTVSQIIEETLANCQYKANQKHITVTTEINNPQQRELWVNGMLIVQALSNLVSNAIAYSNEETMVFVRVTVDEYTSVFSVEDSGYGIPKESQERIFERFYRVDTARSRNQGGTGLGLSIVKHIVGVHGGKVMVKSKLGTGSKFTITLPSSSRDLDNLQSRSDALYQRD